MELKGTYEDLTLKAFYENTSWQEDYVHITLTDEEDVPDAVGKLRTIYHRLMKLDYDNTRTRSQGELQAAEEIEAKSPLQLFSDFYQGQNNLPMSREQADFVRALMERVWEGEP